MTLLAGEWCVSYSGSVKRPHPIPHATKLAVVAVLSLLPPSSVVRRAAAAESATALTNLVVETNFPSGSGKVIEINQDERLIKLEPSSHEGRGWACWWYVRVSGFEAGETISLQVGRAPWATPERAAFSSDGETWRQTAAGERNGAWITYRHKVDAPVAWFAWGPPFTPRDSEELIHFATAANSQAARYELCKTRDGRIVPALKIGSDDGSGTAGVWIQARQHAWESGSSWVCRGLVEWLVSEHPRAVQLREKAIVSIVPVMDIDSVAIGAGGKDQTPHDHNRDWTDQPHWPAVAAAMKEIAQRNQNHKLDLFIDLHNPGASTTRPFFYVPPRKLLSAKRERNLERFLATARAEITGPLPFVGETRESGAGYDKRWQAISKNWVTMNTQEHVVATTLETAWNTEHSTTDGYRSVGQQLGLAIERYLRFNPRDEIAQETKPGQHER
ncbi:MAG: zinc carboxypeptidase [Planctomycetaceae bacterium]|jgi:hypothetical protein|nr:zinc carboxypeptidase [Planctomycetaceae bacterium]